MSGVAQELVVEHHSIDERLADVVAGLDEGEVRAEAFRAAATELKHHIFVEEEHLFPPLRAAGMIPPVLVMLREHGEMWGVLEMIEGLLAAPSPDAAVLREACGRLMDQLDAHNLKEEQILYPAADQTLAPQDQESVSTALVDGDLPGDWRASMAPPR
ncbi:hemerythrin domain-containing protein [Janibacter limosus]|uniref:hemerythrin domain-containing protein n=1 Tax=Janibacter limosus TaxID=53458 RepID=UPI00082EF970|nr:hemerythrin domain-containing protein [Janibacter limosus]